VHRCRSSGLSHLLPGPGRAYLGQDERQLEQDKATLYWALNSDRLLSEFVVGDNPALVPSSITLAKADAELVSEPGATWVLKEKLDPLRQAYDLILIDCPPTLTLLTVNALAAADAVLIPVKTDLLSTLGVPQLLDTVGKIQRRANPNLVVLGIVPTLFNARFAHDAEVLAELEATFGRQLRLFEPINRSTSFDRAAGSGQPTVALEPGSSGAVAYRRLASELLETL
jgi:chromosome partitioning protein